MPTVQSTARTPAAPLVAAVATIPAVSPSFDTRWAAWLAKGEAHDRAVRRKLATAAPLLVVLALVVFYTLVIR